MRVPTCCAKVSFFNIFYLQASVSFECTGMLFDVDVNVDVDVDVNVN